jgi:hypothetical protein
MLFLPSAKREEVQHRKAVKRIIEFIDLEGVCHAPAGAIPCGSRKIVGRAVHSPSASNSAEHASRVPTISHRRVPNLHRL